MVAEPYLAKLRRLTAEWMRLDAGVGTLECRHFFSGAAVFREDSIVASLTPVGLAFKVTDDVREKLLNSGKAVPLRYFPDSPIKREYVVFPDSEIAHRDAVRLILGETS